MFGHPVLAPIAEALAPKVPFVLLEGNLEVGRGVVTEVYERTLDS